VLAQLLVLRSLLLVALRRMVVIHQQQQERQYASLLRSAGGAVKIVSWNQQVTWDKLLFYYLIGTAVVTKNVEKPSLSPMLLQGERLPAVAHRRYKTRIDDPFLSHLEPLLLR